MATTAAISFDNLVLSCAFEKYRTHEEFVPEHFLAIQLSGETHMQTPGKTDVYREGSIMLLRKNQLMRSVKVPAKNGEYKSVLILLNERVLRKYATTYNIPVQRRYEGEAIMMFESDDFFRGYFNSLLPYVDSSIKKTHALSDLKICEAIELLLRRDVGLRAFLFDFHGPYKLDLEEFMVKNFIFNVPVTQFARLTGRSLAAFKRDFKRVFGMPPREWLMQQRLSEAYRLIKEKGSKSADIYIEIGFENLSHFYYSFKKRFGVTPSQIG